ncbi:hypothetical protein C7999DRAFT_27325 [Corynascus novoguineensis]|uniref:Uncharacterized protein n=1 Tax=Corynascus novoguineensis TaxID=1126955 RepID=A0AAN7D1I1_9PEZI|nr:hypothetical protein C7999DRAFT_27325 [Corynascus novoguineensis]
MTDPGFITLHEAQPPRPSISQGVTRPPISTPHPGYSAQVGQQQQHQPPAPPPPPPAAIRSLNTGGQLYYAQSPQPVQQQYYAGPTATQAAQQQYHSPHVTISDLRKDRPLTVEEAREALSEYFVIRITRVDEGGFASDGSKQKLSWERVAFVEEPGIDQQAVAKRVRDLNRTGISVTQKKEDLSEAQNRQVEKALVILKERMDDAWFHTTLVQLDDRIEEKPKQKSSRKKGTERERKTAGRHNEYRGLFNTKAPAKTHSKSKDQDKVVTERVYIKAYFKRSPRSGVDPIALLRSADARSNIQIQGVQQPHPNPMTLPQSPQYPQTAQESMPPLRTNEVRGPDSRQHGQAYANGPSRPIIHPAPQKHTHATVRRAFPYRRPPLSPRIHNRARSPAISTDDSAYSEIFSVGDNDADYTPPSTPLSSGSRDLFDDRPQKSQYREMPSHYGIRPEFKPKHQGPIHIQTHQSNERRPSSVDLKQPIQIPSQPPFPPQSNAPARGPEVTAPRQGDMNNTASAVPPPMRPAPPAAGQAQSRPREGPTQFQPPPPPPPPPPPGAPRQAQSVGPNAQSQYIPGPPHQGNMQGQGPLGPNPPPLLNTHLRGSGIVQAPGPGGANQGMNGAAYPNQMNHSPTGNPNHPTGTNGTIPEATINPGTLYANVYKDAITMAERVITAAARNAGAGNAAAPPKRPGTTPVVIQGDRERRYSGTGRVHGRESDDDDLDDVDEIGSDKAVIITTVGQEAAAEIEAGTGIAITAIIIEMVTPTAAAVGTRHINNPDRDRDRDWNSDSDSDSDRGRVRSRRARQSYRSQRDRSNTRPLSLSPPPPVAIAAGRLPTRTTYAPAPAHTHAQVPAASRTAPPSGVRLVRPGDGYVRPRVGMDRAGLERDMGRLRVVDSDGAEAHGGAGGGVYTGYEYGNGRYDDGDDDDGSNRDREPREERYQRGDTTTTSERVRVADRAWEMDRDRDREMRAERLRREEDEEQFARGRRATDDGFERRRRDSGVEIGDVPFADRANPFAPRPSHPRRTGAGVYTR